MWNLASSAASIRTRLILALSTLLGAGILAAIVVTLLAARSRIDTEIASSIDLASLLVRYALDDVSGAADPDAALSRLQQALAKVRHIEVVYVARPGSAGLQAMPSPAAASPRPWLLGLFEPARIVATYPVTIRGNAQGDLVMKTRPSDEAAEIWGTLVFLTAFFGAIAATIAASILATAQTTLKPLAELVEGLGRLREGRFDTMGEIEIAELREIGRQFNELARSLTRTRADNRLLVDRLMSIQDNERKALARELHDEFGAALFGIRAAASCIVEEASAGTPSADKAEIIGRARTISSLADRIQKQIGRILEDIRPSILERIGLVDALRDLVASFRATHRGIVCETSLPGEGPALDEDVSLTIYRIVQEGLTNVARHSGARHVRVALAFEPNDGTGRGTIRVSVADDGRGLSAEFGYGFGLLGMTERLRKIGGRLEVSNRSSGGAEIEATIPVDREPGGTLAPTAPPVPFDS